VHDRADVGEVEVDQTRDRDQVGDALDALTEDVVGGAERLEDRGAALDDRQQPLVRDDDLGVDHLTQAADALVGLARAVGALEGERAGDDADGERVDLVLCDLGDDRRCTGAGATALAGGDEDHVGALQRLLQIVAALVRGRVADLRVRAGAKAARQLGADLQLHVGVRHLQRLSVGVHRNELDTLQARVDHAVHGVRAAAADADDLDDGQVAAAFSSSSEAQVHLRVVPGSL
jgi:hypothetical protein